MPAPSTRHIEPLLTLTAPPPVPANTVAPVISGTRIVGQTLSCTTGTWDGSPSSFAYSWKRDNAFIGGATASTYVAVTADIGHAITCLVTATNASGPSVAAVSNALTIVAEWDVADIKWYLAAASGLGGSPAGQIVNATDVFDAVTNPQSVSGSVEYRAIYIRNTHPIRSSTLTTIWVNAQTSSPTTDIAIGLAPQVAGTDVASIPTEATAPVGVTFTAPASSDVGLSIGTLTPGQNKGIWLRRTVIAGTSPVGVDACQLGHMETPV